MNALRYEWVRLRTLRSTWIMSAVSVAFSALMGFLAIPIIDQDPSQLGWLSVLTIGVPTVTALCCGLVGVFAVGHEFRYGSIRPTLTALPRRIPVMVAKLAVAALFSLALSVVCLLTNFGIAWGLVRSDLETAVWSATVLRVLLGAALYAVGFSIAGAGFTALFRNQVAGIVTLIVLPLIVESAIAIALALIPWFERIEDWSRFLPFSAGRAMSAPPASVLDDLQTLPLSPVGGGLVYFGFCSIICALGTWRFVRRDA
jgi:ABC-2 type transport system permease protein